MWHFFCRLLDWLKMESQVAPAGGGKNTGREDVGGLFLSFAVVLVRLWFCIRTQMVENLWWEGLVRTPLTIALQDAN